MKLVRVEWDTRRFMAEMGGRVVAGMEAACEFVEGQARALAPSRTGKLREGLDHEVLARGEVIEGRVGQRAGRAGAFYAYFLELGTKRMAARPHLRPAVFEHGAEIVRLVAGGGS